MTLTRRAMMAGLLAGAAQPVLANAPATSPRPLARDPELRKALIPSAGDLVDAANLGGRVSFAVADAGTGEILESRAPLLPQPPASTAKALTTLYGLDALGPDFRFATRLVATGPLVDGRLEGDLILAGGGDPTLDTDALGDMAAALKEAGLREITGTFRIWTGTLPEVREVDAEQPDHVAYNPSISGLNLNFNRVYFGWERTKDTYEVSIEARDARFRPGVSVAQMEVVDRRTPVYTYTDTGDADAWTVARGALGGGGARWLPVRRPALYAAEVFRTLARSHGIQLGQETGRAQSDEGEVLVEHLSAPLSDILRDMMEYSTNLTAEIVGLTASRRRMGEVPTLAASAGHMSGWLGETMLARSAAFEDHSGLGDDSRISAADMVKAMVKAGPDSRLRDLMKPFPVEAMPGVEVAAKTGTLNFVSALTGFETAPNGRELAFAIFCADVPRRDALAPSQRERPEGGRYWIGRSRNLQRALLARWGGLYGA